MAESVTRKITEAALRDCRRRNVAFLYDTEIRGFRARFNADGSITFYYRYRSKKTGKRPEMKLGLWTPKWGADKARAKALKMASDLKDGIEPRIADEEERREQEKAEQEKAINRDQLVGVFFEQQFKPYQLRNKLGNEDLARIQRRFSHWFGRNMLDLKRRDVTTWQMKWEKKLAYATLRREYGVLQAMLNYAVHLDVIDRNPLQGVNLKRPPAKTDTELVAETTRDDRRALEKHEIEALFTGLQRYTQVMKDTRRRSRLKKSNRHLADWDQVTFVDYSVPVVLCLYYGGFRPGDIFGLRWEHLNSDFTMISKVVEKIAHHDKGRMVFQMEEAMGEVLKTWWEQRGKPNIGYVFAQKNTPEKRLSKSAMRKSWPKIKKLGGLPDSLDLYTLRHNFASQLIMNGVDLMTVSKMMGHADIQTTINNYGHLRQEHMKEALTKIADNMGRFDIKKPHLTVVK